MQGIFFFFNNFLFSCFLITDIPFTEYNERKKRNLTPQNFRPALHIVTKGVSGEMPVQRWGVCLCVWGCAGGRLAHHTTATAACWDPRPARHLCQPQPNPQISTLARRRLRSSSWVACGKTLGFRPGCSFSHSLGVCWLLGIPLAPRRKCPIFIFDIRRQSVCSPLHRLAPIHASFGAKAK